MNRKKVFNELVVKYFNGLYPPFEWEGKPTYNVAEEWKAIKDIKGENEFLSAVNTKKKGCIEESSRTSTERKQHGLLCKGKNEDFDTCANQCRVTVIK